MNSSTLRKSLLEKLWPAESPCWDRLRALVIHEDDQAFAVDMDDPRVRELINECGKKREPPKECVHRGRDVIDKVKCKTCEGDVYAHVFQCTIHGRCTPFAAPIDGARACRGCDDLQEPTPESATPYVVHVGYDNPVYQDFVKRCARDLNLGYRFVSVRAGMFQSATIVKQAALAVIWNGQHWTGPLVKQMCELRGIPTVFFEWGMLPQSTTFLVDPKGLCGDSVLNGDLAWLTDRDALELDVVRASLQERYPLEPVPGRVLILLQIENDSQVLYHTPFNSMNDFIAWAEQEYAGREVVVRPHPKSSAKPTVTTARVDRDGDLFEAARRAELVVGLTSTALYEAAALGVPVCAVGAHPLNTTAERKDRVVAGALALRVDRATGSLSSILRRFGIKPKALALKAG